MGQKIIKTNGRYGIYDKVGVFGTEWKKERDSCRICCSSLPFPSLSLQILVNWIVLPL